VSNQSKTIAKIVTEEGDNMSLYVCWSWVVDLFGGVI
jgi:hypothetical protein